GAARRRDDARGSAGDVAPVRRKPGAVRELHFCGRAAGECRPRPGGSQGAGSVVARRRSAAGARASSGVAPRLTVLDVERSTGSLIWAAFQETTRVLTEAVTEPTRTCRLDAHAMKRPVVRALLALLVIGLIRGGYGLLSAWRD